MEQLNASIGKDRNDFLWLAASQAYCKGVQVIQVAVTTFWSNDSKSDNLNGHLAGRSKYDIRKILNYKK